MNLRYTAYKAKLADAIRDGRVVRYSDNSFRVFDSVDLALQEIDDCAADYREAFIQPPQGADGVK